MNKKEQLHKIVEDILVSINGKNYDESMSVFLDDRLKVEEITYSADENIWIGALICWDTGISDGPRIEINTKTNKVCGYWDSDYYEKTYKDNGFNEIVFDYYE